MTIFHRVRGGSAMLAILLCLSILVSGSVDTVWAKSQPTGPVFVTNPTFEARRNFSGCASSVNMDFVAKAGAFDPADRSFGDFLRGVKSVLAFECAAAAEVNFNAFADGAFQGAGKVALSDLNVAFTLLSAPVAALSKPDGMVEGAANAEASSHDDAAADLPPPVAAQAEVSTSTTPPPPSGDGPESSNQTSAPGTQARGSITATHADLTQLLAQQGFQNIRQDGAKVFADLPAGFRLERAWSSLTTAQLAADQVKQMSQAIPPVEIHLSADKTKLSYYLNWLPTSAVWDFAKKEGRDLSIDQTKTELRTALRSISYRYVMDRQDHRLGCNFLLCRYELIFEPKQNGHGPEAAALAVKHLVAEIVPAFDRWTVSHLGAAASILPEAEQHTPRLLRGYETIETEAFRVLEEGRTTLHAYLETRAATFSEAEFDGVCDAVGTAISADDGSFDSQAGDVQAADIKARLEQSETDDTLRHLPLRCAERHFHPRGDFADAFRLLELQRLVTPRQGDISRYQALLHLVGGQGLPSDLPKARAALKVAEFMGDSAASDWLEKTEAINQNPVQPQ